MIDRTAAPGWHSATKPEKIAGTMRWRFRLGVRAFLFVLLVGSTTLPVALLAWFQAQRSMEREGARIDRRALAAAWAAAEHLRFAMTSHVRAAESFSAQVAARDSLDPDVLGPVLRAHVTTQPEFLGAYIANAAGVSVLNASAGGVLHPGGTNYADRDYFETLSTTRRTAISGAAVGRVTHVLTVQVAAPILDASGGLRGLTCSSLNLGTITEQAEHHVRGMVDGRLVFVDGAGRRIADSDAPTDAEPDDIAKHALFAPGHSKEGELRIGIDDRGRLVRAALVELGAPVGDWRVFALTPEASAAAHGQRIRNEGLSVALASLVVGLALAAWLSAWLSRPIRALARASEAVTRGEDENVPALPPGAPREFEQLSTSIASMIAGLRGQARNLEAQVAERTRALSDANAELSHALERIQKNERAIREDIENARLFQARMLPHLPALPAIDIAVHYAALEQVSGDIYDLSTLEAPEQGLRIFLADATGHGVQASMRTIVLKSAYDRLKTRERDPRALLEALNAYLVSEFAEGELHATATCLDLTKRGDEFEATYVNGGGAPLYVFAPGVRVREIYAPGPLLGAERVRFPEVERFSLAPGQLLLIASDGVIEQWNGARERFEAKLAELRLEPLSSAQGAIERVLAAFDGFRGTVDPTDDLTLIAILVR